MKANASVMEVIKIASLSVEVEKANDEVLKETENTKGEQGEDDPNKQGTDMGFTSATVPTKLFTDPILSLDSDGNDFVAESSLVRGGSDNSVDDIELINHVDFGKIESWVDETEKEENW